MAQKIQDAIGQSGTYLAEAMGVNETNLTGYGAPSSPNVGAEKAAQSLEI